MWQKKDVVVVVVVWGVGSCVVFQFWKGSGLVMSCLHILSCLFVFVDYLLSSYFDFSVLGHHVLFRLCARQDMKNRTRRDRYPFRKWKITRPPPPPRALCATCDGFRLPAELLALWPNDFYIFWSNGNGNDFYFCTFFPTNHFHWTKIYKSYIPSFSFYVFKVCHQMYTTITWPNSLITRP